MSRRSIKGIQIFKSLIHAIYQVAIDSIMSTLHCIITGEDSSFIQQIYDSYLSKVLSPFKQHATLLNANVLTALSQ